VITRQYLEAAAAGGRSPVSPRTVRPEADTRPVDTPWEGIAEMTRPEIPESDRVWEPGERATTPTDAPEADAAEQSRPLRPEEESSARPLVGLEVDEYDAVEQSRVVVDDDEYDR
jgi:hypothetical protein